MERSPPALDAPPMTLTGAEALEEVQNMFPHLNPEVRPAAPDSDMTQAPLLGRRTRETTTTETDPDQNPDKFSRPAGKGQTVAAGKTSLAEQAQASRDSQPSQPSQTPGHSKSGRQRQWTEKEWDEWTKWESNNKELSTKELQRELEHLREDVRLLARISMRHEDELSQKRTETDFILTLEVANGSGEEGILEQLYKMTVKWKADQEQGKVSNSLRLTLFIGLLLYYEVKVVEAMDSADTIERLAGLGYLRQVNGNPAWNYLQWNYEKEELEATPQTPLPDSDLRVLLTTLKTSIGAPGTLLRFHSSRKLVERHKTAVTFFLGIGLRDPQSLIVYRALQQLSFNASTQLIKMRLKPVKMERQPLVKVLQEKFPAPPARSEEDRVQFLAKARQQWKKGQSKGQGKAPPAAKRGDTQELE